MTPLQTLQAMRAALPTPMSDDQIGELLNAVAWTHRVDGWGLLKKPSGAHCKQPQTGIEVSRDILCRIVGANLDLYDVLIASEGKATPTWGKKKPLQDLTRWIAPVDAKVTLPPVPPDPPKPPAGHGQPYPDEPTWWTEALAEISRLYALKGESLNLGMFKWVARTAYDIGAGTPKEQSITKHLGELRAALGL